MLWPPVKSWTCRSPVLGYRHFVAINYGGKGTQRWVALVSVLDGESRIIVSWEEMLDSSKWMTGWEKLPREESFPSNLDLKNIRNLHKCSYKTSCLHASKDSGLLIPSEKSLERPWKT